MKVHKLIKEVIPLKKATQSILAAMLLLVMAVSTSFPAFAAVGFGNFGSGSDGYVDVSSLYRQTNQFRTSKNVWYWNRGNLSRTYFNTNSSNQLKAFKRDSALEKTARTHAKELSQRFSHTRPNGKDCFTAYPHYSALGENIAMGQSNAAEALNSWKETNNLYSGQGHRRNMLSKSYNAIGIAGYRHNGTIYWVQSFGKV